jgi:ribonuclease D
VPFATPFTISRDRVNALPLLRYAGPVTVVSRADEVAAVREHLRGETLLGFDTETRPAFRVGERHPVALLQLAGAEHVFVFQLQGIGALDPLFEILADPAVLKVGVEVQHDVAELARLRAFTPRGFVDVGGLARERDVRTTGLRSLCAMFLGGRLAKGTKTSDWSRRELTAGQVMYAATDAWAGRELYLRLAAGGGPIHAEPAIDEQGAADEA